MPRSTDSECPHVPLSNCGKPLEGIYLRTLPGWGPSASTISYIEASWEIPIHYKQLSKSVSVVRPAGSTAVPAAEKLIELQLRVLKGPKMTEIIENVQQP